MKVLVKDIREVSTKYRGTCVRFSVTFLAEDGEPDCTIEGFLMDHERKVSPPAVPAGRRWMEWTHVSDRFREQLKVAVSGMKSVQAILGPEPPALVVNDDEASI